MARRLDTTPGGGQVNTSECIIYTGPRVIGATARFAKVVPMVPTLG